MRPARERVEKRTVFLVIAAAVLAFFGLVAATVGFAELPHSFLFALWAVPFILIMSFFLDS